MGLFMMSQASPGNPAVIHYLLMQKMDCWEAIGLVYLLCGIHPSGGTWTLKYYFDQASRFSDEAAKIDGAGNLKIMLPDRISHYRARNDLHCNLRLVWSWNDLSIL